MPTLSNGETNMDIDNVEEGNHHNCLFSFQLERLIEGRDKTGLLEPCWIQ